MLTTPLLRRTVTATALLLLLSGCSGGADEDSGAADQSATTDDAAADDAAADDAAADDAAADTDDSDEDAAAGGDGTDFFAVEPYAGAGTGTVTYADGTELTAPLTCTIGQRELAGRELLYTATASGGDVQFDMTIYGDAGAVDSVVLNLTAADGQRTSAGGPLAAGPFELTQVGATIVGAATFTPGHAGDTAVEGEPREGEVLVECS